MRQRRVGTVTLGGMLVLYGILFLLSSFIDGITYYMIFQLWPVLLIVLGIEVLFSTIRWKEQEFKYDFAAILIICILVCFALGMAGLDWLYQHDFLYWGY